MNDPPNGSAPSERPDRIVAGILVGGASHRMSRPKALLPHPHAGTLIEHVVNVARDTVGDVVLLGAADKIPGSLQSLSMLPDVRPDSGPVAGLCALLRHVGAGWGLMLSCDLPLLERGVLDRLTAAIAPDVDAVAFAHAGKSGLLHACCALYHTRALPIARKELDRKRRLQAVLGAARTRVLQASHDEARQLSNVNTLEDARRLGLTGR